MRASKILVHFLVYISFVITYFLISIFLNYKVYNIFALVFGAVILGFMTLGTIKSMGKNKKLPLLKKTSSTSIMFMCAAMFLSKDLIDHVNLGILKKSSQDLPVYRVVKNSRVSERERKEYDKAFKTSTYQKVTVYYKSDFEPALELVNAYLDKAKADNIRLFGDIELSDLTIKFDYDEEVFKKRDPSFKDYSGLYVKNEKTIYLLIRDCYSSALALNIKSSYLRQTLLHEYTHHIVYEFLKSNQIPESKVPMWFIEGISEYIGYEGDSGNPPVKMSDFQELSTRKQWTEYNNKGNYPYEQSHYAVRELALIKGEKSLKKYY